MVHQPITFETLPAAIGVLLAEVSELKTIITDLRAEPIVRDQHYNVQEAAKFLGIAEQTVYQNIRRIPHAKRFGKLYFLRSELEIYLSQGKVSTSNR